MRGSFLGRLRALLRDERGLSTVEYVVLLVLIVAMAVAAWNAFGRSVTGKLGAASGAFDRSVVAGDEASPPGAGTVSGPRTVEAE